MSGTSGLVLGWGERGQIAKIDCKEQGTRVSSYEISLSLIFLHSTPGIEIATRVPQRYFEGIWSLELNPDSSPARCIILGKPLKFLRLNFPHL